MNLSNTQEYKLKNSIASGLFRTGVATPREALAVGVVLTENLNNILCSSSDFQDHWVSAIQDVEVDGKETNLNADKMLAALVELKFVDYLLGTDVVVAGERTIEILDLDTSSYAPELANKGVNRRFDYTKKNNSTSELYVRAIHALESTKFTVSLGMLRIAKKVLRVAQTNMQGSDELKLMESQEFVIKGSAAMNHELAYVSEFSGDPRGRLYQAACYGPNGQSSDLARSLMNLANVSNNYDMEATIKLLMDELSDMTSDKSKMEEDMNKATGNSVEFILTHMTKNRHIKKPWNFVKFSHLIKQLHAGKKPYIGIAVGLDAKGSGPQLGALQVGDTDMMIKTGLTQKKPEEGNGHKFDPYLDAVNECKNNGVYSLNRALIKKPFMSVFYGASKASMFDIKTITKETYDALYAGLNVVDNAEEMEEIAENLFKAINKSFGGKLRNIRKKFREVGYDYDMEEVKYDKPVAYKMPDGFDVKMDYRMEFDLDNKEIGREIGEKECVINTLNGSSIFKNPTFRSYDLDLGKYARTGYVNMIQATDALLARLIIVKAQELGVQHIISVHDCFRVNIHDMRILKKAIEAAYMELFGNKNNQPTDNLPLGSDILGLYFKGSKDATKECYKEAAPSNSQFYKDGNRNFTSVNGEYFKNIIKSLTSTNPQEVKAKYFSK